MLTFKKDTTLVGVAELRTQMDEVLKRAQDTRVIIEKRNKPVAVILDIARYNEIEAILNALEDIALGYLAKERDAKTALSEYIDIEEALE